MTSTFDLVAHPERIHPAYGFYAVFWAAGTVLTALTSLAVRRRWKRFYFLLAFSPLWAIGVVTLTILDARDVLKVRKLVERREYATIEGCLTSFHPGLPYGTKTTASNERWSVAGEDFDYGAGEVRPGYSRVEALGGLVHRDSRVRVSFVRSPYYHRNEIVRLVASSDACPPAPDASGY